MNEEEKIEKLRNKCHDNSFHSYGKAYIHEQRCRKYGMYINLLTTLGIIVPVTVGATVLGYGIQNTSLKLMISIAIPTSIIQLIFSLISVVYKWSDELSYSNESAQEHYFLSERFKKLGEFPPGSFNQLNFEFELINTRLKSRKEQDSKHSFKDWELRKGMRYSLRENQKQCIECKSIPTSMENTECNVCGKFSFKYKLISIIK